MSIRPAALEGRVCPGGADGGREGAERGRGAQREGALVPITLLLTVLKLEALKAKQEMKRCFKKLQILPEIITLSLEPPF